MNDRVNLLKHICSLHMVTKRYLILAEELGETTLLQPVKEFRDAYDHILRTFFCNEDDPNVLKELDAAKSHEFRAYIDTMDYFCMLLKEKIFSEVSKFNVTELINKYPRYNKMRLFILESYDQITDIREERNHWDQQDAIDKYKKIADKMYAYYSELITALYS